MQENHLKKHQNINFLYFNSQCIHNVINIHGGSTEEVKHLRPLVSVQSEDFVSDKAPHLDPSRQVAADSDTPPEL